MYRPTQDNRRIWMFTNVADLKRVDRLFNQNVEKKTS